MKRSPIISLFILFIILSPHLGFGASLKIGFVDLQRALNESEAGKKAKKEFQEKVNKLQKKLARMQGEIKRLQNELEKQGMLLSDQAKEEKEREYKRRLKDFQRLYKDSQEELQAKDAELTKKIIKELQKVIIQYGKDKGYSLILEKSESSILYGDRDIDITNEIIRIYNTKFTKK
jgi:outer membrane protein